VLAASGLLIGADFSVWGWILGATVMAMGIAERELQRYQIRISRSAIAMVFKYPVWQKSATYPLEDIASYVDALSPIRGDTKVVGRYLLMKDGSRFHLPLKDVQH